MSDRRSASNSPIGVLSCRFIILIATLLLLAVTGSYGSPSGTRKSVRSSVFSLFNLKEKSKYWSESVIHGADFDDLESSTSEKMSLLNYTKAGNIANYLVLQEVDSLYLPIPLNFIFIGFEGKGNQEFKLNPEELERWFMKIDHIFEHTRVPQIGEVLAPFYKISIDKEQCHHLPIISHIIYNFSVHAIQMGEKVTSIFEHAINFLSRKDDVSANSDDGDILYQVDVDTMGVLFTSLVEYLQLENAYNIFVLNPKHDFKRAKYGYMRGLSESEITFLKENQSLLEKILQSGSIPESALELEKLKRSLYEKHPMANDDGDILYQVDVDTMGVLFTSLVEYLQLENAYNIFVLNPKHDFKRAKYGYRRGLSESEITFLKENKSLLEKILQSGSIPESALELEKLKRPLYEKHPMAKFAWTITEDTDTVEWYNICLNALNNIEKLYLGKDISDIIQSKVLQLLKRKNEDFKLLEKELKSGGFSDIHAECLTDTWIGRERWAFIDLTAGPFSWGPAVGGEGVRTEISLPNVTKTIGAVAEISEDEAEDRLQDAIQEKFAVFSDKDHHAIDILLAEIDIYELFAFKHCKGRRVKLALCEELDERMQDLKSELQSFEGDEYDENHKKKAVEALKRMEGWNIFTDSYEESQNYTVARDTFLADLGATLWGSMRHIISPSIADGAFHYYEKISFQLFFITQEKVKNDKQLPVDLKALKDGLSSLLLPSQKPMFSHNLLPLSEDPALAMAFSVARRAAAVPLLLVNGTYRKTIRTYLDSSILQYQLQRLSEHASLKGAHAHSRSTLEVPIFWFIHGDPLLVDKHYQAKALSDMVIVVQSEQSSWESHLQCNGRSLLWDLRRPIKAAMAAVSEHLSGLLPLHIVYSRAHEAAIEDWTWSVGCNPLSVTSGGWQISQFQSDTIARSYVITSLEESIELVNSAIRRLLMERTSEKTFRLFQSQERELVNKYNYVVGLWRRISTISGELRYVDAMRLLYTLEDASKGFRDQVNTTIALLHPVHCTTERNVHVVFDMTTIPAFLTVVSVLYFVLKPRRQKPKIN